MRTPVGDRMTSEPLSSCVFACKCGNRIGRAVARFLQQSCRDIGCISSGRKSEDCGCKVTQHFAWMDSRVRFPKSLLNIGYVRKVEQSVQRAASKRVSAFHPDDVYNRRILERRQPLHDADPSVGGKFSFPAVFSRTSKVQKRLAFDRKRRMRLRSMPGECVAVKREWLNRYTFSICYEYAKDCPGYITDKIFDCLFSGCVPVYQGPPNTAEHISALCFIARERFRDLADPHEYLVSTREVERGSHVEAALKYLRSPAMIPFTGSYFARSLADAAIDPSQAIEWGR